MICAACGEATETSPCTACGKPPLLEERYRLEAMLGQGAVGTTYRAVRLSDEHVVAIKEMLLRRADTPKARELMQREVSLLRQLEHPGIPQHVEDFVAGSGKHRSLYLVQDFVDGRSLRERLAEQRFDEARVIELLDGVLDILGYLHSLRPPVIHRDLKPGNVMERDDGSLVLIDFGAARDAVRDPDLGGSTVAGTFGYMAPEQFQGDATPATDLYALGIFAAVLLTRRDPNEMRESTSLERWLEAAHVSLPLRRLLSRLIAEEPRDRPRSAAEVQRQLRRIAKAEPPQETPPATTPPPRPLSPSPMPALSAPPLSAETLSPTEHPVPHRARFVWATLSMVALGMLGFAVLKDTTGGPSRAIIKEAAPIVAPPEPEPRPLCGGAPCTPVGEGQLKGVQLGMTRAEAEAALEELASADELGPERIHAPVSPLDMDLLLNAVGQAQELPGFRLQVDTTLLDTPATCTLHFAEEDRLSKLHCELEDTRSASMHSALRRGLYEGLIDRYGPPQEHALPTPRWEDATGTLELYSSYTELLGLGGMGELSVTLTSAAHLAAVDAARARAQAALDDAAAQQKQEEAERVRALREGQGGEDL